jgi:hypothetical protein
MEMEMGMRRSTRQELRMLRGIVRSVLEDTLCHFCKEPLLEDDNHYAHGAGEGSPIPELTEHHKDGDHDNNAKKNRVWTHRRCHKSFHLTERHKANRKLRNRKQ